MGLAFVGLIVAGYKLRVNELKRRERVLKVMVQAANRGTPCV